LLEEEFEGVISVGRGFQRNLGLVWTREDELEVEMYAASQWRGDSGVRRVERKGLGIRW
jgi:hypothetical protein